MRMTLSRISLMAAAAIWPVYAPAQDVDPESLARGREISRAVSDSDKGYGDEVVTGRLIMRQSDGSEVTRGFRMSTLEKIDAGDKRAVAFLEPRDLAGFVSLNYSGLLEPDDQWIYLPQLDRTRRLSARDRSGSFAGSEFSYEEIVRWEYEKYDYAHVGSVNCGAAKRCEVLENTPKYPFSGYSKLIESVDMTILQPRKIVYFNHNGKPFKTLELLDYEKFDRFWRPRKMRMSNHENGRVSEIEWGRYEFKTGLKENDFLVESIKNWAR